jgi:hypothetical protein
MISNHQKQIKQSYNILSFCNKTKINSLSIQSFYDKKSKFLSNQNVNGIQINVNI